MTESQILPTLAVRKIPNFIDTHITSCEKICAASINKRTSKFEILVQKMSIGCDLHLCKILLAFTWSYGCICRASKLLQILYCFATLPWDNLPLWKPFSKHG